MTDTLSQSRDDLYRLLEDGVVTWCPCCGKRCKFDPHRLHAGLILCLMEAHDRFGTEPFDLPVEMPLKRHMPLYDAKHWGLFMRRNDLDVERSVPIGRAKYTSMWQVTSRGADFLHGDIAVPVKVKVFIDTVREISKQRMGVAGLLRMGGFDYEELMGQDDLDYEKLFEQLPSKQRGVASSLTNKKAGLRP
jgi:hypothetical protein